MKFKWISIAVLVFIAVVGFSTGNCKLKIPTCDNFELTSFIGIDSAYARGGRSSFSSGSRSSGRSSWSSKPSSSKPSTTKPNKSISIGKKDTTNKKSSFSTNTNTSMKKQKAVAARKKYTSMKYNTKPSSTLTSSPKTQARAQRYYSNNAGRTYTNKTDYYRVRDTYYSSYRPPVYINTMPYSSFGMWDILWLSMIMDNMHDHHNAQWMYNHQNDPGVQEYRAEMQKMAAENAEVKAKLATMDAELAAMKGTPIDENYILPGVDPSMAMAPDLVESQIPNKRNHALSFLITVIVLILIVSGMVVFFFCRSR